MKVRYKVGVDIPKSIPELLYDMVKKAIGHDRAISRETIQSVFLDRYNVDIDDRMIRKAAEAIRNNGVRLIDLEDGRGFFIAQTEEEYQHFRARYGSHAFTILRTIRAMDNGVNAAEITDDEIIATKPTAVQLQLE
jgi:hypothetical protein